jgi:methylated-DNA-protein-cysteine methyltransferase-like protein
VGYALHAAPDGLGLPWHRVINSQGRISLPRTGGMYDVQRSLLEAEGVHMRADRIDLTRYGWSR